MPHLYGSGAEAYNAVELISGETLNGSFTAKSYEPMLVKLTEAPELTVTADVNSTDTGITYDITVFGNTERKLELLIRVNDSEGNMIGFCTVEKIFENGENVKGSMVKPENAAEIEIAVVDSIFTMNRISDISVYTIK